jgi:hypothetical protein
MSRKLRSWRKDGPLGRRRPSALAAACPAATGLVVVRLCAPDRRRGAGMRSDPRAVWGSVWGSPWGSAWGSMASERVGNSPSTRSTRVNTRSVEIPTRDRARARPRTDRLRLHSIAVWITERDERICIELFEHRVLTSRLSGLEHWLKRLKGSLSEVRELLAYKRRRSASSLWSPISRPPEPVWSPKGR